MTTVRYGASPSDWDHFSLVLGLTEHLLPVVSRPDAPISPGSSLKRLGQIPSLYNSDRKVVGIAKWTERHTTPTEIESFRAEPDYGICVQTRSVRALDCDITSDDLAAAVFEFIANKVVLPTRGRSNAPKFLKPFFLEGKHSKRILKLKGGNPGDKIEFLADGQQFIAAGMHPSGVPYQWAGGLPLEIPTLTADQFEQLWSELEQQFGLEPSSISSFSERLPAGGEINDALLPFLETTNVILGWSQEGAAYISCPFKSNHSKEGDKTETIYFPAGLRGYEAGHFKCMHASCASRSDDDFLNALSYTQSLFDIVPDEIKPNTAERFTPVPVADYAGRPPPQWLVKHVIPKADLVVLFGESGSGKSFLALDMIFAIARGVPWNNKKVQQGSAIYICAEDAGGVRNRVAAYAQHFRIDLKDVPLSIIADVPNFLIEKDVKQLTSAIEKFGNPSLIVIDTFAQVTPGANENSAEDIGKALRYCRYLGSTTGATVLLIHHAGKDLTKGARGWSGLRAAADAEIELTRFGDARNIRVSKQKNSEDGATWGMNLIPVTIGLDEDNEAINSCVIEIVAPKNVKEVVNKLGIIEQLIVSTYENLGQGTQPVELLSQEVKRQMPHPEGKDNRNFRIRRSLETLVSRGVLRVEDDAITEIFLT